MRAHHLSIETLPRTGRRRDPTRSFWYCSCGAGNPLYASPAAAHAEADRHAVFMDGLPRIGLVSCSGQKATRRAPARELYTSPLFVKSLRHALGGCQAVYILSAKHGLVELDQELEPYDERIGGKLARRAWGERVAEQLAERWPSEHELYLLAGADYARPLCAAADRRWPITQPLHGLEIGERLAWLNAHVLPVA